jgi:flagellar hook-length control protein FliK
MQILDLLGSTASTAKVQQTDLTSQKDAFAKHLNDVMSHRDDMRTEEAKVHALRQEDRSARPERDERPEHEENLEAVDTEEAPDADVQEEANVNAQENKQPKEASASETKVATPGMEIVKILAAGMKPDVSLDAVIKSEVSEETIIGQAATDALEEVVAEGTSGIVAALEMANVANKASQTAAVNSNAKSASPEKVNEKSGPFKSTADANTLDPTAAAAAAVTPDDAIKEVSGLAMEVAAKTDMADPSDDVQIISQAAVQNSAQQINAPAAKGQERAQSVGKGKIEQVVAETPLIKDAKIVVGPDPRLTEMQIAQALVEEAAAEKIHAQFMVGTGPTNNMAAFNQLASVQSSGALETAAPAGLQAAQNKPMGPVRPPENEGMGQLAEAAAKPDAAPKPSPQIAQPAPNQSGLANTDANAQPSMSERAASTLAQLTAQAAQGRTGGKPSQAAMPAAAAGAEAVSNAMNNSATTAPTAAIAEVGAPSGTQMANAAKPATPPPPPTQQPPQAQVAMHIAKGVQNGTDKISIRLNPSELGRVDIKLEVGRDGAVTASVTVERPETLELLKGDARSLERALANAGLDPDSDNLSFNLRDQNNNNNSFAKNADGDGKGSGQSQDGNNSANGEENDLDVEALLAEARASASHDRALDINV